MRLGSKVSAVLALWLLLTGCGESREASKDESTVTETVAASDNTPTRLTHLGGTGWPVFSPDGQKIAFFNQPTGIEVRNGTIPPLQAPFELYVMNSDGTNPIRLTNQANYAGSTFSGVAFSPDGTKIAFVGSEPELSNAEIYVVDVDGTNLNNLTNSPAHDTAPTWSPGGQTIAFESNRNVRSDRDIYVMNSDGTNPINLTNNVVAHERTPTFYPDKDQIAFSKFPGGVYVMDTEGSISTRLTDTPIPGPLRFSPDEEKIAFEDRFNVYVMNSDGTDLILVAEGDASLFPDFSPVFLPEEQEIAVKGNSEGNDEIYAVDTESTNLRNLTKNPSAHDTQPAFSPDGKQMAFASQRYDESGMFVSEIYLMNLGR